MTTANDFSRRIFVAGLGGRIATNLIFIALEMVGGDLCKLPIIGVSTRGKKVPKEFKGIADRLRRDMILGPLPYGITVKGYLIDNSAPDDRYGELHFSYKGKDAKFIVPVYDGSSPESLPLAELNVDVLLNATGKFMDLEGSERFLKAGAKKIILTGPPKNRAEIQEIIYPLNGHLDSGIKVVSLMSCTTNAVAPVVHVLAKHLNKTPLDILLSTTHAITNSQDPLPSSKDSGSMDNILGYTTGASKSLRSAIPNLSEVDGHALRVPVANGSMVGVNMVFDKKIPTEQIAYALQEVPEGEFADIIGLYDYERFETRNVLRDSHTAVVNLEPPFIRGGLIVYILIAYDNEYAYSWHAMLAALRCPIPE